MKGIINWSILNRWYFNQTLSIYPDKAKKNKKSCRKSFNGIHLSYCETQVSYYDTIPFLFMWGSYCANNLTQIKIYRGISSLRC